MALYRKWRPQRFGEVVGQDPIARTLARAVATDRVAHAYLFSGPRGTGKTSMAKILAKAVNCRRRESSEPCNECDLCQAITQGTSFDVLEIDAASNRGIDEIRALRETVAQLPALARKKVYIVDEAHMLTKEAANALLKTLEEPPAHVIFILATTEPERLPATIISRCQRYEFRRIDVETMTRQLQKVAAGSAIGLTEEAARLIAVRADGGLRDALSLLDQCAGAEIGEINPAAVAALLGLPQKESILALGKLVLARDAAGALAAWEQLLQSGKEPTAALQELLRWARDLLLAKALPGAAELLVYGAALAELQTLATQVSAERIGALARAMEDGLRDIRFATSARLQSELVLLRLCRVGGEGTAEDFERRLAALENQPQELPASLLERIAALEEKAASAAVPAAQETATTPAATAISRPSAVISSADETDMSSHPAIKSSPAMTEKSSVTAAEPERDAADLPDEEQDGVSEEELADLRRGAADGLPTRQEVTPPVAGSVAAAVPPPAVSTPEAATPPVAGLTGSQIATDAVQDGSHQDKAPAAERFFVPLAAYEELWRNAVNELVKRKRFAEYTCYRSAELLLVEGSRAVVTLAHSFLVETANRDAYRDLIGAALAKWTGRSLVVTAVRKGSTEEKEARRRAAALPKTSGTGGEQNASGADDAAPAAKDAADAQGYRPIAAADIPEAERNDPVLAHALQFAGDCDIYVKEDQEPSART